MDGTTALAVLGLEPGASRPEIRSAFRARAKVAHPDHAGATDTFVALLDAYRTALATTGARGDAGEPGPAPVPPRRPRGPSRWLAADGAPGPSIDVRDIAAPTVIRSTVWRPRPARSFEHCLAEAMAA